MTTRSPAISDRMRADHCAVREAMVTEVSTVYAKSNSTYWAKWEQYSASIGLKLYLLHINGPVPFLHFFAHSVQTGELAEKNKTCQKRQVEQYLHVVGQVLSSKGSRDPRLDAFGHTNFWILRQLRSYT